jgi:hypothetical protein
MPDENNQLNQMLISIREIFCHEGVKFPEWVIRQIGCRRMDLETDAIPRKYCR